MLQVILYSNKHFLKIWSWGALHWKREEIMTSNSKRFHYENIDYMASAFTLIIAQQSSGCRTTFGRRGYVERTTFHLLSFLRGSLGPSTVTLMAFW